MRACKLKILLLGVATALTACSFVSLDPQARDVMVQNDANVLKGCKFLGNTTVSLWSKAETFQRHDTVKDQLDTLARNEAATMGGDRITPYSAINNGKRTYSVYKCLSH